MKKLGIVLMSFVTILLLSGCQQTDNKLYVLNWGEYIDQDLVAEFEALHDVTVIYEEVGSNEEMEVKIKSGVTNYDIAFPSDYMIDKLRQQGLLNEIDYDLLNGFDDVSLLPEVKALYEDEAYAPYLVPYFWGTIGIMYNTDTVDEADLTGWDVLFTNEHGYKMGMYDSARDAIASALLYLDEDVNTADETVLNNAKQALNNTAYDVFGEDNLKGYVHSGNLDLALVYSGDYFDEMYTAEADGETINFAFYVPEKTNVWIDGFVIPKSSQNLSLAHEFINFFLHHDRSVRNADWVGYAPVLEEVYNTMVSDEYGYDYDNYHPYPDGSERVIYQYISQERFELLNAILNEVKANQ
ncbi:MAG: extracellular solute-binding protein [Candidatus Izemoplasma sp.]|nr:extracellular solute-binding protein [Candidatus Izemoplasma sp.]